ncbi:hypothetical protein [Actinoallomurus acaciae]|uniref:Secreted protein with PEP-CTERM sorting signal n=1 Tax=Actinoallomurus acaciae TaxID=502577 RepID=A0ABV5YD64_9ACTN
MSIAQLTGAVLVLAGLVGLIWSLRYAIGDRRTSRGQRRRSHRRHR